MKSQRKSSSRFEMIFAVTLRRVFGKIMGCLPRGVGNLIRILTNYPASGSYNRISCFWATIIAMVSLSPPGLVIADSSVVFPLSVASSPSKAMPNALRLVVREKSDVTITTYHYIGAKRKGISSPKLEYRPETRIKELLSAADFTVLPNDSPESEQATVFVRYSEKKRGRGLDSPTAFYLSYSLFHSTAGKIAHGATNPEGCDTPDELQADPVLRDLGKTVREALSKNLEPCKVKVILSSSRPRFRPGIIMTIPDQIKMIDNITLAPNRESFAYTGRKADRQVIMLGKKVIDEFDVLIDRLVFHPNSLNLGYTIERGGARFMGIDGYAGCGFTSASGLCFSPCGKRFAYIAKRGDHSFVVINNQAGPMFDTIKTMTAFSSRGDHAYWGVKENQLYLVHNGEKRLATWSKYTMPTFSPDGELSYIAKKEGSWYKKIGDSQKKLSIKGDVLAGPFFSPSGNRQAILVKEGKKAYFLVGEQEERRFHGHLSKPVFSPDGQHLAYKVKEGQKEYVVAAGRESSRYEKVFEPILFSRDGNKISFGFKKDRELHLKALDLEKMTVRQIRNPIWKTSLASISASSLLSKRGNLLLLTTNDSSLYAIDSKTGQKVWSYRTTRYNVTPKIAVGNNAVIVLHTYHISRKVICLDIENGNEIWTFDGSRSWESGSPIVSNGRVFLRTSDTLYALDEKNGKKIWTKRLAGGGGRQRILSFISVQDLLVFTASNGKFWAINGKTSKEVWSRKFDTKKRIRLGPISSGTTLFFALENSLYAIDANTGSDIWKFESSDKLKKPFLTGGYVFIKNVNGKYLCFDPETGKSITEYQIGHAKQPIIVSGTSGYFADNGNLFAIDLKTGEELWRNEGVGSRNTRPVVGDDMAYFASGDQLLAFNVAQ